MILFIISQMEKLNFINTLIIHVDGGKEGFNYLSNLIGDKRKNSPRYSEVTNEQLQVIAFDTLGRHIGEFRPYVSNKLGCDMHSDGLTDLDKKRLAQSFNTLVKTLEKYIKKTKIKIDIIDHQIAIHKNEIQSIEDENEIQSIEDKEKIKQIEVSIAKLFTERMELTKQIYEIENSRT